MLRALEGYKRQGVILKVPAPQKVAEALQAWRTDGSKGPSLRTADSYGLIDVEATLAETKKQALALVVGETVKLIVGTCSGKLSCFCCW